MSRNDEFFLARDERARKHEEAEGIIDELRAALVVARAALQEEADRSTRLQEEVAVAQQERDEALRVSYPKTPVDCLISELREQYELHRKNTSEHLRFEARVAQFKSEVAGVPVPVEKPNLALSPIKSTAGSVPVETTEERADG